MSMHLEKIAFHVALGAHAVLLFYPTADCWEAVAEVRCRHGED